MTNPRLGRSALLLTTCLALVLASCGGADDDRADRVPAASEPSSAEGSPAVMVEEPAVGLEDAAAAAVKAVDGSSLLTIETEQGRTVWEATVVTSDGTEHEMLISAEDGELVDGPSTRVDDADDKAENRRRVASAEVGYTAAAESVREAVPDARLMELNLDTFEDRVTAWEGDLHGDNGVRWSVKIDARNGDVLEKDADADDDD